MDGFYKELNKYEGKEVDREKFIGVFESENNSDSYFVYFFTEEEDNEFLMKSYLDDDPRTYDFKDRLESGDLDSVEQMPYPHMNLYAEMYEDEDTGKWEMHDLSLSKMYETGCYLWCRPWQVDKLTKGERECVTRVLKRMLA